MPTTPILVIDDNFVNRHILQKMLTKAGYYVDTAVDGMDGLRCIESKSYALVLLDLMMPNWDGYDLLTHLASQRTFSLPPIVIVSAMDDMESVIRCLELGATDHLPKPVPESLLLAKVKTILTVHKQKRQLQDLVGRLNEKNQELARQNQELDAFAYTVAHNLKNGLTSISLFAELIQEESFEAGYEDIGSYVMRILESHQDMQTTIEGLLLLARIRKVADVPQERLDVKGLAEQAYQRVAHTQQIEVVSVIWEEDWPLAVGYEPWVVEVLSNYLSNAFKYGGRPLEVRVGGDRDGEFGRYWVRDNGEGIAAGDQERLFVPFERLNQVVAEGHGLGLAIVQRIVERLGGKVGVDSVMGEGTVFWFTLPLAL
ncbi:MAG TPA: response regulator [Anaerolineae bacterium]|nr:response regulator [Anaerolineae bacterium]